MQPPGPRPSPSEVSDRTDLRRLVDLYGIAVDDRDTELYVSLFVEDGTLIVRSFASTQPVTFSGPTLQQLMDVVAPYAATLHVVGNHVVDLAGEVATGRTYCTAHHLRRDRRGDSSMTLLVSYHDWFVRTNEGWRFRRRECDLLWRTLAPLDLAAAAWPPTAEQ